MNKCLSCQVELSDPRPKRCKKCFLKIWERPLKERFEKYVNKTLPCWIWEGSKDSHGYGHIKDNKKLKISSRVSWELYRGKIPKNMFVCHTCDNPSCVNPEHLWIGSHTDNMRDSFSKNRMTRHRGEDNCRSKITMKIANKIRKLYSDKNITQRQIANMFKISNQLVSLIIRNESWIL